MPPPPASGDLNSHSELSAWRSHSPRMWVMRVIVLHPFTKFEVRRLSRSRRYGWFSVTAFIGLVTLTFDLSTSKWGHGSLVSWASFLPIFSFPRPSILDLGQARDRRTDNGHQCTTFLPCRAGHPKRCYVQCVVRRGDYLHKVKVEEYMYVVIIFRVIICLFAAVNECLKRLWRGVMVRLCWKCRETPANHWTNCRCTTKVIIIIYYLCPRHPRRGH